VPKRCWHIDDQHQGQPRRPHNMRLALSTPSKFQKGCPDIQLIRHTQHRPPTPPPGHITTQAVKLEPQCHTTWPSATQAAQDKLHVDHKATPPKSGAAAPTYSQICWDKQTDKYWHTCLQEAMSHFIDILTYKCYVTKHC
jgi:hypothetical protein